MKRVLRYQLLVSVLALCFLVPHVGYAAPDADVDFPVGTVTVLIPWGAGGRTDIAARVWAPFMEKELGVPVIVSNVPGAGGVIGGTALIHSAPTGYTFGVLSISLNLAQWTAVPPFEFNRVEPVCQIFASPMTLTVPADAPWETLEEYLAYAEANPGSLLHSASGVGTSQHVISAAFHAAAGVDVRFVPYEGDGPAALAIADGEVNAGGSPMIALRPFVDAGEVRVLGISSAERSPMYPDIPTFKEQGVDFVMESFDGIYVAQGTPEPVLRALEAAFEGMANNPEFVAAMEAIDYEVAFMPRDAFMEYLETTNEILYETVKELDLIVGQ